MKITRLLGPGMAFCDGDMTVDGALGRDESVLPQMKIYVTVLMQKKGGDWQLADACPYGFLQPAPETAKTS